MTTTDLIIIGAGPGGYHAAAHAARHGFRVTLFERAQPGGTCLNVGCIPTKSLAHDAGVIRTLRQASAYGGSADINFDQAYTAALQRKERVVSQLRDGLKTLLSHPAITWVHDTARLVTPHTVRAETSGEEYSAPHVLLATGSTPKLPTHIELAPGTVCDSTALLSRPSPPRRLCVVGAGVVGLELASIYQAFGSEVTVIEFLKECLPSLDTDIARRLRKSMEKSGVTFRLQAAVSAVCRTADGTSLVTYTCKGQEDRLEADTVLMAVGRAPHVRIAAEGGIACDERHGISVDRHFETSVPGVYAVGDCIGAPMLAHAAAMQGIHVVNRLLGLPDDIRFDIMPAAVFTSPEAAGVGPTEQQLKAAGTPYRCMKGLYRANGRALSADEPEGLVKLLVASSSDADTASGRLLGCHVVGAHAADLVQQVSALMARDVTLAQLRDIIPIHPTLQEIVHDIALQA